MAELEVVADDGTRLWVNVSGSGPPVAFCHGGPGMWDTLEPLAALIDDVATVYRWDQRGCGRSAGTGPYTVARIVADLEAVRASVRVARWVVLGHSWGALLGLHYAIAHPERTAALIYASGQGLLDSWQNHNRARYHDEQARRRGRGDGERIGELAARRRTPEEEREFRLLSWRPDLTPDRAAEELLRADIEAPYEINFEANRALEDDAREHTAELRAAVARLEVPVLVVHGQHDPRPVEGAEELAGVLPQAELAVIDCGHHPWLERPEETASTLRPFLANLPR